MESLFKLSSRLLKLTIFGRSILLIALELLANALFWVATVLLFGRETRSILNLALLSWTLGLRHALDADHISAIDNATRGLIGLGQLPVTCGLYFSLGHSTIVVAVIVAIIVSVNIYDKLVVFGRVGRIVGASRKMDRHDTIVSSTAGEEGGHRPQTRIHGSTLFMKIIGPIITFVDRPWKMYPVGLLFGLSFDTASSISVLAISAIAKHGPNGKAIPASHVIVLPLLFTAGMSLVDSVDSVLMLYSYSGFPERRFSLFVKRDSFPEVEPGQSVDEDEAKKVEMRVKLNAMSGLSIVLTLISILVAFSISLITIMGLIGDECTPCREAAEDEANQSLAARWWRGWAQANNNSGYIGAAIVGTFILVVLGWYGIRRLMKRR